MGEGHAVQGLEIELEAVTKQMSAWQSDGKKLLGDIDTNGSDVMKGVDLPE